MKCIIYSSILIFKDIKDYIIYFELYLSFMFSIELLVLETKMCFDRLGALYLYSRLKVGVCISLYSCFLKTAMMEQHS